MNPSRIRKALDDRDPMMAKNHVSPTPKLIRFSGIAAESNRGSGKDRKTTSEQRCLGQRLKMQ